MSENSELVEDLVGAIINSDQIEQQNWQTFSLVIAFQDDRVSETSAIPTMLRESGKPFRSGHVW